MKYILHQPSMHEPPDAVYWFDGERLREYTGSAMVASNTSILEARHMMLKRPVGFDVGEFFEWVEKRTGQVWETVETEESPEEVLSSRR